MSVIQETSSREEAVMYSYLLFVTINYSLSSFTMYLKQGLHLFKSNKTMFQNKQVLYIDNKAELMWIESPLNLTWQLSEVQEYKLRAGPFLCTTKP